MELFHFLRARTRVGKENGLEQLSLVRFENLETRQLLAVDLIGTLGDSTHQLDALNVAPGMLDAPIEIVVAPNQTVYAQHRISDLVEIRFQPLDGTFEQLLRTEADIRIEHAFGSGDDLFFLYTHRILLNDFQDLNFQDGVDALKGYVVSERRAYNLMDLGLWTSDNVFGNSVRFVESDDGLIVLHDELRNDLVHTRFYLTNDGKELSTLGNETFTALFQDAVDRIVELDAGFLFDGLQFDRGSGQQLEGIWTLDDIADANSRTQLVAEFDTPLKQFEFSPRGPRELTLLDGVAFFTTDDGESGLEVWRTDGSADNTSLLKDINTTGSSSPSHLTAAGGNLFFFADASTDTVGASRQLWVSDGTTDGTQRVGSPLLDAASVAATVELNDRFVFFSESNGTVRLWSTDGTSDGTEVFAAVEGSFSFEPVVFELNDQVFFLFDDGVHGREWWVTDGTKAGTALAVDIRPGPESSLPQETVIRGNELIFAADDGDGFDIWSIEVNSALVEPILGDANNDLEVNFLDFLILSDNFGKTVEGGTESGDFNKDGSVNFQDFLVISNNFGNATTA